jgi:prepilin-type N-terminal cleavage/methylation domain-containing protein
MKIKTSRKAGFTLVEIMIVVAIIGLLAAIAIPNFLRARSTSQQNACINNLRQIDGAIQQWALETGQAATAGVTASGVDIQPYLGRGANGTLPWCPEDPTKAFTASYGVNTVSDPPSCLVGGTGGTSVDANYLHDLPQ